MRTVVKTTIALLNLARWSMLSFAILPLLLPAFGRYGLVVGFFGFLAFLAFFVPATVIIKTLQTCALGKGENNDR